MKKKLKIDLPEFVEIGDNKLKNLFKILLFHRLKFEKVLLFGDSKTFLLGGETIASIFKKEKIKFLKHLISNSDEENVKNIKNFIKEEKPDLVIGFGGGKVLDVAKLAAGKCKTKFISIPTILSNDGIASPVSVIKDKNNIPISHITKAPHGVIVDINIIKKAPIRHIRAGVGDLISNLSAVFDARLAQSKGIEKTDSMALRLAKAGPISLLQFKNKSIKSNEFLLCLAHGLIKSGFAMCTVGSSRPASGSEHKISHSIDYLYSPRKTLHGEQVGIGTIFTMALQENKYLDKVKKLYAQIAFPQNLKHLGITEDEFIEVICNVKNIRPERYTILEDKKLTPKEIRKIIKKAKL